ncbi:hypothetical protein WA171_005517 [Blastocystis sp. BT1]
MSEVEEFTYRCFACELVREGQILLGLSPVVSASGQTLCHRFYYFYSFKQFHPFFVSMTCLFIGSKMEEELRPVSRTIKVFYRIFQRRTGQEVIDLAESDPIFIRWRAILLDTEKLILSAFGYHLYGVIDHPHRYILFFIKKLECDEIVAQRAWNILNDSLQLPLCLQYTANAIACASIYLAAMTLGVSLPQTVEWWELFDASLEDIQMIVHSIIQLYSRKRIQWIPDVESLPEGTKSTISTLEESRVVSPTMEETALQYVSNNDIRSNSFEPKSIAATNNVPSLPLEDHPNRSYSHHNHSQSHYRRHSHSRRGSSRSRSHSRSHHRSSRHHSSSHRH